MLEATSIPALLPALDKWDCLPLGGFEGKDGIGSSSRPKEGVVLIGKDHIL